MKIDNTTPKETPLAIQLEALVGIFAEQLFVSEDNDGTIEVLTGISWETAGEIPSWKQDTVRTWATKRQATKISQDRVVRG